MQQTWWRHSCWVWDYRWRFRIRQFRGGRWHWFQHHCRTRRIWATPYRPQSMFLSYHLARKYGFKEAGQLNHVLASKDVNHIQKSTIATHWLLGQMRMKAENITMWNSQVKMIRSVIAEPAANLDQLDAPTITTYNHNIMKDMLKILVPFEHSVRWPSLPVLSS